MMGPLAIKHILTAGMGIVLVSTTVSLVILLGERYNSSNVETEHAKTSAVRDGTFSFEDFISSRFTAKKFNGSWWSNEELQWKDLDGNLVAWNFKTNQTTIIVSNDRLASVSQGAQFQGFSPNNKMILFAYDIEQVWRHSFTAKYLVVDIQTNQTTMIKSPNGDDRLQYCNWVENDENESILIHVFENNIYWRPNAIQDDWIAITEDGIINNIFNGIPDWVYEEEVLSTNTAHYISPAGYKVAFAQFNDTLVPEFKYPSYGNPMDIFNAKYPKEKKVRYPKSGEINPTVRLLVREITEEYNKMVTPPSEVLSWNEYIYTDVEWVDDNILSVVWMNRIQNESFYTRCHESSDIWICDIVYSYKQDKGWIEPGAPLIYDTEGTNFLLTISSLQHDGRHYSHIAKIGGDGKEKFLTEGLFVVTDILSWDESNQVIYFMGTEENSPGSRHLYSVDDSGAKSITCLTCKIESLSTSVCEYNNVIINEMNSHYVHICLGKVIPEVHLRRLTDGSLVYILENNNELRESLQNKIIPEYIETSFSLEGGFTGPAKIFLPSDQNPDDKYPLVVYIYGGPGSQQVDSRWSLGWESYMSGARQTVYALIDGRGTGFQSDEHKFTVYKNLGTVEMEDHIAMTRQLVASYPFIDEHRVGIWGWSYGGFSTVMTLEQDVGPDPVFNCGISVAPVSSWLLYDSIYTERYMNLPADNPNGYNHSAITGIENLRTKKWMLNHGVADDNVHFQHSMLLTRAMEQADVQFEEHTYADENHSLGGVRRFLYHAMDDFWTRCFTS